MLHLAVNRVENPIQMNDVVIETSTLMIVEKDHPARNIGTCQMTDGEEAACVEETGKLKCEDPRDGRRVKKKTKSNVNDNSALIRHSGKTRNPELELNLVAITKICTMNRNSLRRKVIGKFDPRNTSVLNWSLKKRLSLVRVGTVIAMVLVSENLSTAKTSYQRMFQARKNTRSILRRRNIRNLRRRKRIRNKSKRP